MSIENFDHGQNKAAAFIEFIDEDDLATVEAIGIRSAVRQGDGKILLELVEAIGEAEFFALATRVHDATLLDGVRQAVTVVWIDDTHFQVVMVNDEGLIESGAGWVVIYKVIGGLGSVPVTNEEPPPG